MIARRGEMMPARGAEYEWECRLVVLLNKRSTVSKKTLKGSSKPTYVVVDAGVGVVGAVNNPGGRGTFAAETDTPMTVGLNTRTADVRPVDSEAAPPFLSPIAQLRVTSAAAADGGGDDDVHNVDLR